MTTTMTERGFKQMAARRRYRIECDGPGCEMFVQTTKAFVAEARQEVKDDWFDWWKVGYSDQVGAKDFCSKRCEDLYRAVNGG